MAVFGRTKYDEDHRKKWDEFENDYENLAKKLEALLPEIRERKRAFERLVESFQWMGRTLRTSQIRSYEKAKKDSERAKKDSELPIKEEVLPTPPKRILILKKSV